MTLASNERRPAPASADLQGSRAASKRNRAKSTADRPRSGSSDSLLPTRLEWAAGLIGRAQGHVPAYGSAEWEQLPDTSAEKVAACIVAAECWRTSTDPAWIAWKLRTELEAAQAADDAPGVWTPEVVDQVHRSANRPSFAELSERRREPQAAARGRAHQRRLGLVPVG